MINFKFLCDRLGNIWGMEMQQLGNHFFRTFCSIRDETAGMEETRRAPKFLPRQFYQVTSVSISMPSLKSREIRCLAHRYLCLTSRWDQLASDYNENQVSCVYCVFREIGHRRPKFCQSLCVCDIVCEVMTWNDSSVWFLTLLHAVTMLQQKVSRKFVDLIIHLCSHSKRIAICVHAFDGMDMNRFRHWLMLSGYRQQS